MGVLKMLTAKKSVGSLPTLRLTTRYPSDSSSSDSSSRHSSSDHAKSDSLDDSPTAASARPSRKRCSFPTSSVPITLSVRKALSLVRSNLSPPPKRIRDSDSVTDLEVSLEDGYESYVLRVTRLGVDIKDINESYTEPDIDSDIQAYIDECFAYADAIRSIGIDDRDVVKTAAEEEVKFRERDMVEVEVDSRVEPVIKDDVCESVREDVLDHVTANGAVGVTYETLRDLVQRFHDHTIEIPVHRIQVIESVQRFQGHKFTGVDLEVTIMTERMDALEWDNTRLRGMLDVESQRVDRLQHVRLGRLETCAMRIVGVDATYAMTWKALVKLMTEVYCPRNEIQKMETDLWNLTMVPKEEDKVEKYIGVLSDNIQGNVIAAEPTRLQHAICIANNLMDQKLKGYAIKNAENKR
ncbi:hypothetical protein Tco_1189822, partial [Tanacetum coccineum]